MTRPPFEVADIICAEGRSFIDKNRSWLNGGHLKVLAAIERCRTSALGGHRDRCAKCGHQAISFNSCRNRHCPKCQTNAREKWLAKRSADLLPMPYVHVVFTLPHLLAPLAYHNKKLLYDLLFRASAATLLEVAANPKRLGAELGFLSVLHTWGQTLQHHPHVHCVIPAGGLSPDHQRWIHARSGFFLPVGVLRKVFRGKFTEGLKRLWREKLLCLPGSLNVLQQEKTFRTFLRSLHRKKWVVYSKPPFGGPKHVLQYLARYTHRVAISNHRIVNFAECEVSFRWKDYAHGSQQRVMTLEAEEFLRRFLQHTLPLRFVRLRRFGFLAHRQRTVSLALCRGLLDTAEVPAPVVAKPAERLGPVRTAEVPWRSSKDSPLNSLPQRLSLIAPDSMGGKSNRGYAPARPLHMCLLSENNRSARLDRPLDATLPGISSRPFHPTALRLASHNPKPAFLRSVPSP